MNDWIYDAIGGGDKKPYEPHSKPSSANTDNADTLHKWFAPSYRFLFEAHFESSTAPTRPLTLQEEAANERLRKTILDVVAA